MFKKWILLALFVSMPAAAGRITSFSIGYPVSHWELTFGVTNSPKCQFFVITNPDRLVADCYGLNHKPDINFNELNNFPTPVSRIRVAVRSKNELRMVLDLKHPIYAGVSQGSKAMTIDLLPLPSNERHTRVDDVRGLSSSDSYHSTAQRYQLVSEKSQLNRANAERDTSTPSRDIMVVIDPGHGGKDPGATGPAGTHEKNVVLQIAKKLQHDIKMHYGFDAKLTRSSDRFIPLDGRLRIAREDKADMFVAIHADAFSDPKVKGLSVFSLSTKGAISVANHWVNGANKDATLLDGVQLSSKSADLRAALVSRSLDAVMKTSSDVGDSVLEHAKAVARLHRDYVVPAAFVVLKSPDIPSILIETGFLSNRSEEQKLTSPFYQAKLANAIANGLTRYFAIHPPPATELYTLNHSRGKKLFHIVVAGDTLGQIATRYGTTLSQLMKLNNLKSTRIYVDEKLLVKRVN